MENGIYEQEPYNDIETQWSRQKKLIAKLKEIGAEKFFRSLPNIESAFKPKDRFVRCIDERTAGGAIHLAGSGILLGKTKAKEILESAGAKGIFSHSDCGACKIFARQNNLDVSTPEKLDEVAIKWAESLAQITGLPYKGHLKPALEFHNATVIYFDGTGNFDNTQVESAPPGFTISQKFLPRDYTLKELEIAVKIALSDHGFGPRFTAAYPLTVIVLGSHEENNISQQELSEWLKQFGNKISVDRFDWPQ